VCSASHSRRVLQTFLWTHFILLSFISWDNICGCCRKRARKAGPLHTHHPSNPSRRYWCSNMAFLSAIAYPFHLQFSFEKESMLLRSIKLLQALMDALHTDSVYIWIDNILSPFHCKILWHVWQRKDACRVPTSHFHRNDAIVLLILLFSFVRFYKLYVKVFLGCTVLGTK
jgi:hypothetical protein